MALEGIPKFRWKSERKDFPRPPPMMVTLAESVLQVKLEDAPAPSAPGVLWQEQTYNENLVVNSPDAATSPHQQHAGPTHGAMHNPMAVDSPSRLVGVEVTNSIHFFSLWTYIYRSTV